MRRALQEFRIRGVATNINFLERLVSDEAFRQGQITTRFIDDNPELLAFARPRDRASRLLRYIAETTVNGHPEVKDRPKPPAYARNPKLPPLHTKEPAPGAKALLDAEGPDAVAAWMLAQERVLVTDTTMRDAHQSLLATRMRTHDLCQVAPAYAHNLPQLFSLECWVDLTRFGGHLISCEKGVHDVAYTSALSLRVPGADGRAGSLGPLSGGVGSGVRTVRSVDPQLGRPGRP